MLSFCVNTYVPPIYVKNTSKFLVRFINLYPIIDIVQTSLIIGKKINNKRNTIYGGKAAFILMINSDGLWVQKTRSSQGSPQLKICGNTWDFVPTGDSGNAERKRFSYGCLPQGNLPKKLCPKQRTPPTHPYSLALKKSDRKFHERKTTGCFFSLGLP